jgi:hypothetical protein
MDRGRFLSNKTIPGSKLWKTHFQIPVGTYR